MAALVANCKLMTAFAATCIDYAHSILRFHSGTEAVLISSLAITGLKCPFHLLLFFFFPFRGCKIKKRMCRCKLKANLSGKRCGKNFQMCPNETKCVLLLQPKSELQQRFQIGKTWRWTKNFLGKESYTKKKPTLIRYSYGKRGGRVRIKKRINFY